MLWSPVSLGEQEQEEAEKGRVEQVEQEEWTKDWEDPKSEEADHQQQAAGEGSHCTFRSPRGGNGL